jgi:ribosomal protein L29
MKATELRELDADGLRARAAEIEKPVALRDARRNLARVKTVLREKAK